MFTNKVWVLENDIFIKGIKTDTNTYINEETKTQLLGQVWERSDDVQSDMINLSIINDPQLLYNLSQRYKQDEIFTYVGPTLIVINPFKSINYQLNNYIDHIIKNKLNYKSIRPHTYAIACNAFTKLNEKIQAIVISGESGAGKTENARYCLNLLTNINGDKNELSDKIMGCNPILEAFGNAKTIRNKNSSRFGKYTRLFVNEQNKIIGGDIVNYLLEKSRVVTQSISDRNFHIFYLIFGNNKYKRIKFNYLGNDEYFDQQFYNELIQAFKTMNINIEIIFQIVYAILLIGELKFDEATYGNDTPCTIINQNQLSEICSLLNYDQKDIQIALTFKQATYGKEKIKTPLKLQDCYRIRDSWAKELYERLFNSIIEKLNENLINQNKEKYIGLLDIYGFEVFDNFNGFEQLMINYSNERLHQLYIEYVFKEERKIFIREDLGNYVDNIKFEDNSQLIDLFDKPNLCLFNLIDQSCKLNQNDNQLLQTIRKELKFKQTLKQTFLIIHTAKEVEYTCQDFIEKNLDEIPILLLEAKCQNPMIQLQSKPKSIVQKIKNEMKSLMTELQQCGVHFIRCIKPNDELTPNYLNLKYALKQIRYLGVLDSLKVRKESYPIRVDYWRFYLKYRFIQEGGFEDPLNKDYKTLDKKMFEDQFKIVKQGDYLFGKTQLFLQEITIQQIDVIYKELMKEKNEKVKKIQDAFKSFKLRQQFIKYMQMIHKIKQQMIRWVKMMQFRKKMKAALLIQQYYYQYLIRKKQKIYRKQINYIKLAIQSKIYSIQFQQRLKSIIKIQKNYRINKLIKQIKIFANVRIQMNYIFEQVWKQIQKNAAIIIQKYYRGYRIRKLYQKEIQQIKYVGLQVRINKKIKIIQKWARGYIVRQRLSKMHQAAYLIQGYFRMRHLSCVFQRMRAAAIIIQRRFRMILPRRRQLRAQYTEFIEPMELELQQQKLKEENDLFGNQDDYNSILRNGMESLITQKIYLFSFILDLEIISDTKECYNESFSKNFRNIFIKSFEKENPIQTIQIGQNSSIVACNNKLFAWGLNDMSQLGIQADGDIHNLTQIKLNYKIKQISNGSNHTLVLSYDNKMYIWGTIQQKQIQQPKLLHENVSFIKAYKNRILYISQGKFYDQLKFKNISKQKINQISCGSGFTLLLCETGLIYSYGQNEKGQLGLGDLQSREQPQKILINDKIIQIECGFKHVIVLSSLKKIYTWGSGEFGQLGTGDFNNKLYPIQLNQIADQVMAGMKCSCILNKNAQWCGTNGTISMQPLFKPILQKCNYLQRKEYQIVRILSSYENNLSLIYCTYACLRGVFDNNIGKGYQIIKQLTTQWVYNNIWSIDPPYVENINNYLCEKYQQIKPQSTIQKNNKVNQQFDINMYL